MASAATLKINHSDLNFGYVPMAPKAELLKISIYRIYNQSGETLVAFRIDGNNDQIDHLTATDGALYMSLNEMKWLSHHLTEPRFAQLKAFFVNITHHVKDVIAISEEFEEYNSAIPTYLQDTIYISSKDSDVITTLLNSILTLN